MLSKGLKRNPYSYIGRRPRKPRVLILKVKTESDREANNLSMWLSRLRKDLRISPKNWKVEKR